MLEQAPKESTELRYTTELQDVSWAVSGGWVCTCTLLWFEVNVVVLKRTEISTLRAEGCHSPLEQWEQNQKQ